MTPDEIRKVLNDHQAWCQGTGGARANLGDANLGGAYLGGAYLRDANLRDANLRDADLRGANLRDANLGDANLGGADLRAADLRGAYLRDANLGGADLRGAYLRDANLGGANLEAARLPGGWAWWQGGAYGPRRRMIRAHRTPDSPDIMIQAGCISGSAEDVKRQLTEDRHPDWVGEIGQAAADRALAQAVQLIDIAAEACTPLEVKSDG